MTETPQSNQAPRHTLAAVLAALGLLLSVWLEAVHVQTYVEPDAKSFCSVGQTLDCASVAASKYSVILGMPVPVLGILGFLSLFIAALRSSKLLWPLSIVAALSSVVFLVIELALIGSVCLLCEAVHVVTWVLVAVVYRQRDKLTEPMGDRQGLMMTFAAPVGIALAVLLVMPRYWGTFTWKGDVPFPTGKTEAGHPWVGATDPKLTLQEFIDYNCPHCAVSSAYTLRELARHPGKLRIVRRQQPRMRCPKLDNNTHCRAVRLALCAGDQGKFWQADRYLFVHAPGRQEFDVAHAASELGLNAEKLEACMQSKATFESADAEAKAANEHNMHATPGYLVDGKKVDFEAVKQLLRGL